MAVVSPASENVRFHRLAHRPTITFEVAAEPDVLTAGFEDFGVEVLGDGADAESRPTVAVPEILNPLLLRPRVRYTSGDGHWSTLSFGLGLFRLLGPWAGKPLLLSLCAHHNKRMRSCKQLWNIYVRFYEKRCAEVKACATISCTLRNGWL